MTQALALLKLSRDYGILTALICPKFWTEIGEVKKKKSLKSESLNI